MTSQDFPLPIYPFPHHMLLVHKNIHDLLRTVLQPWLEFGEEQFDHHLFYPSLSEALGTWNSSVPVLPQTGTPEVMLDGWWLPLCIPGLHPQNPCHFAWHPSGWVSQTLQSICFSQVTAATMYEDKSWHIHHSKTHWSICTWLRALSRLVTSA